MTVPVTPVDALVERVIDAAADLPRPTWRGLLHTFGFAASVPAGVILVMMARTGLPRMAAAVFAVALAAVFATSAVYHRGNHTPAAREMWRRLDHSMIFLLIAGTYTPICLLALPSDWGVPILIAVWVTALVGVVCKLVAFHTAGHRASVLYGVLGWALAFTLPQLVVALSAPVLAFLVAGGVCYTAGAFVLAKNRPNPAPATFGYHEIWHAATLVAASFHMAAIALIV